jgi:hypothetical protein
MAYYPDLSPYEYIPGYDVPGMPNLNVGWLDGSRPYPKGKTSHVFREALLEFCFRGNVVVQTRGLHPCTLGKCPNPLPPMQRGENAAYLGSAEIRVIGQGVVYAAPTLIYHYVVAHNYKPPDEFIQAVLTSPRPGSAEYLAVIRRIRA